MFYHIAEQHGVEVRLKNLNLFCCHISKHHLREAALLTIMLKLACQHSSPILRKPVCLNILKIKIFVKAKRILTIFVWPTTKSRRHFARQHLCRAACYVDVFAIVLENTQHEEFPTLYELYLVKKHIDIL